ncbi:DUF1628 domain protein [Natrialba magadii ATCC 43099]|uniref:DUF1628 domain protein n=1 Tax=Natrialba magadii (strain ATCC 43099 / DSM 3394 / CCM 3739 / CIP 104546 / IAM 13178 / JCM 8861 / NBRC 102185 / NCIMB 2190 / MS3) TaxID=547559 RepID=D3SX64_NATMM|nr:type IV pilin N-terminal domain-containing protein [Natrialba magadii]ADD03884.1 DUF1628 domain protein [Natrialba magadii ATCC 43099]ELY33543.1 hypothetical protein C500_01885 [Natrialba magadii ATCC 43099]
MFDKYTAKLVGSEEERAVSPVIGVILMVAITVILAAVIAAFVLDLGGSIGEEAQAGVDLDVDNDSQTISAQVTSAGNADDFEIRGDLYDDSALGTGDEFSGAGDTLTIEGDELAEDGDDAVGTVTVVAIIDDSDTETTVASADFEFEGAHD